LSGSIQAFVGPNGGGKTLAAMALMVQPALAEGREVWSTCEIDHPNARVLESWRQLPDLRGALVLFDEISSCLPSRSFSSVPPQLIRLMNQLRKVDVELAWTAPNWARADVVLREVTQRVTTCQVFVRDKYHREYGVAKFPHLWQPSLRTLDGKPDVRNPKWPSNSLFRWKMYDAQAFEEFSVHVTETLRPVRSYWYWRPFHSAQYLYSTLDAVALLDHIDDTGVCIGCGGTRSRQKCRCAPDELQLRGSAL
jgi:hypothetical protein